jgi:uncharacterized membrane protein
MIDPNIKFEPTILGFGFAALVVTLWWNLDYRRFMKYWVRPPYKSRTIIIFRVLFAVWFLGAASWFLQNLVRTSLSRREYAEMVGAGLAWFLLFWAMETIVARVGRKIANQSAQSADEKPRLKI